MDGIKLKLGAMLAQFLVALGILAIVGILFLLVLIAEKIYMKYFYKMKW
jgi:hypothetical protein